MRRIIGVLVAVVALLASPAGTAIATASSDLGPPTSTSPQSVDRHGLGATLVAVRVGRHLDYDRVVFDLRGSPPGWRVRYEPSLIQDASGKPLTLRGPAVLHVAMLGVVAHNEQGRPTLRTPSILTPELPTLRQVRLSGDDEAIVSFGLGLRDRAGFRVFALTNPTRVVVDVAHQPRQPFRATPVSGRGTAVNALIDGTRAARHPGYDRLVFDIQGAATPAFGVRYVGNSSTIGVGLCGMGSATSSPHASYAGTKGDRTLVVDNVLTRTLVTACPACASSPSPAPARGAPDSSWPPRTETDSA